MENNAFDPTENDEVKLLKWKIKELDDQMLIYTRNITEMQHMIIDKKLKKLNLLNELNAKLIGKIYEL